MTLRRLFAALLLAAPLHACTSDSTEGETDADPATSSGTTSGTAPTDSTSSSSGVGAEDESSSGLESTTGSSGDAESSSGEADASSTGSLGEDVCVGYDILGYRSETSTDGTVEEAPTCDPIPAACGGDVVGTWTLDESCGWEVFPNVFAGRCEGATQQITGSTVVGTRTFGDDGTFVYDVLTEIEADLQIDAMACYGTDCDTFASAFSDDGWAMVCETADDATCSCVYTFELPESLTGTYEVVDESLVLTTSDGDSVGPSPYCVDSGRMSVWSPLYQRTQLPDTACSEAEDCEDQVEGDFDLLTCQPPTPL